MNKEDKNLLVKDLSCRIPYGIKACLDIFNDKSLVNDCKIIGIKSNGQIEYIFLNNLAKCSNYDISLFKPYLRPMSSMTKQEKKEYTELCRQSYIYDVDNVKNLFEWLLKNNFDYNNLIDKGLAIDIVQYNINNGLLSIEQISNSRLNIRKRKKKWKRKILKN